MPTRRAFVVTAALAGLAAGASGYALGSFREAVTAARRRVAGRSATDPALLGAVGEDERRRAELIMNELLPISLRARGIANDGRHSGQPASTDFSAIATPTLVLSCEDDLFGTAETARTVASRVPASRLVVYASGGHVWLGHDTHVAEEIATFVAAAT